ncbi:MAG TPA: phosphatase PAP2 family protein [Sphingomicrobium sp.]|nr:phosphatase PAP2 family protein [Sphingomicrobium sp.]
MTDPLRGRSERVWPAIACVLLAAIWAAMLWLGGGSLDRSLYEALYAGHHPALAHAAEILTDLGSSRVLIIAALVCAICLLLIHQARLALIFVVLMLIGRFLAGLQKHWIARPRPELEAHLVSTNSHAFPSGHAANSMIFYVMFALILTSGTRLERPAIAVAALFSLLIGISRVMLGVHWPSDVVGGWAFGLFWVLLAYRPAKRLLRADSA